jgi:hypothetical protein
MRMGAADTPDGSQSLEDVKTIRKFNLEPTRAEDVQRMKTSGCQNKPNGYENNEYQEVDWRPIVKNRVGLDA